MFDPLDRVDDDDHLNSFSATDLFLILLLSHRRVARPAHSRCHFPARFSSLFAFSVRTSKFVASTSATLASAAVAARAVPHASPIPSFYPRVPRGRRQRMLARKVSVVVDAAAAATTLGTYRYL